MNHEVYFQSSLNKFVRKLHRGQWIVLLLIAVGLLWALLFGSRLSAEPQAPEDLPAGFAEVRIASGMAAPLDMEFLPSGDILVALKGRGSDENGESDILLIQNGVAREEPVITLSTNTYWDSGLLAFVLDPNVANNGYLYVWYATGVNSLNWGGETQLRLSRFTYNHSEGKIDPATELILMDNLTWYRYHHGNSLLFDRDGNLYLGLGDRGRAAEDIQSATTSFGKIYRIRPTETGYEIPADNPFVNEPGAIPEVYAMGVRNPYRMADRASDGTIIIADVGWETWEEANLLVKGANYGWPLREGPCPAGQTQPCAAQDAGYTDPYFYYEHSADLAEGANGAITGIDFYEGDAFPEEYHGKLFIADLNQKFIAYADMNVPGEVKLFAQTNPGELIVDLEYYRGALYYLSITGQLRYIYYTNSDNQVPVAVLEVDTDRGPAGVTVNFSAEQSYDADDVVINYHFDFGDGQMITTTNPVVDHSYAADGTYIASLTVTDPRGGVSQTIEQPIYVYSGEFPQIEVSILNDLNRDEWHGGDQIQFRAMRSTLDGLDPDTPFEWAVDLHHNEHTHPIITSQQTISDVLVIDQDNHDGDWNLWFRVYLTMKTDTGQEIVVSEETFPELVKLRLDSQPATAILNVNGAQRQTPYTLYSIVGVKHEIEAPAELFHDRYIDRFGYWHSFDGPPRAAQSDPADIIEEPMAEIIAPPQNTNYIAQYVFNRLAPAVYLPNIKGDTISPLQAAIPDNE